MQINEYYEKFRLIKTFLVPEDFKRSENNKMRD